MAFSKKKGSIRTKLTFTLIIVLVAWVGVTQIVSMIFLEKYYLSQKACLGILQRAFARGKELPAVLKKALECQSGAFA